MFLILLIMMNHCYREFVNLKSFSATFTQSIEPYTRVDLEQQLLL